jgi:predicted peroxiredoxin
MLDQFYNALFQRGVRIYSVEQSVQLANAVADIIDALCSPTEGAAAGAAQHVASATMASIQGVLQSTEAPAEPIPPA